MEYGKKTVHTSYYEGKVTSTHTLYSIPMAIIDKAHALSEIMTAVEMLSNRKTDEITICLKADKGGNIKMLTKTFEVIE